LGHKQLITHRKKKSHARWIKFAVTKKEKAAREKLALLRRLNFSKGILVFFFLFLVQYFSFHFT